jgi:asparagine synthase (glutamine-hydrolysing)
MAEAIAYRGPDGTTLRTTSRAAFAYLNLDATPGGGGALQPIVADGLTVLFDGWLANPAGLAAALGGAATGNTDAELVHAAVRRWGEDAFARIDGDFAILAWDEHTGRALLSRDRMGQRPLSYRFDGRRLIVASDVAAVLALPDVPRRPDITTLAAMAAFEPHDEERSVWEGIRRTRRAHYVMVDESGPRPAVRYWNPSFEVSLRYRDERDYVEHYRTLLTQAVRRAARCNGPLGCEVSGGQDSSAIFAIADRLLRAGELPAENLTGYTYRFPEGGQGDEVAFARSVARHVGRPVREVEPYLPDAAWMAERIKSDADIPMYPNGTMAIAIGRAARADDCRVVLNGEGGDDWFGGRPTYFAEMLSERAWRELGRALELDRRALGLRTTARNFVTRGILPVLSPRLRPLRPAVRWLRRRRDGYPEGFAPAARQALDRARAEGTGIDYGAIPNWARRVLFMLMTMPTNSRVIEAINRQAGRLGYELRAPFYDRELMEFAYAIPEYVRSRGGVIKHLHSLACDDWLPPEVARRNTKADFSEPFDWLVEASRDELTQAMPARHPEFFDAAGMTRQFDRYVSASYWERLRWPMWGAFIAGNLLDLADPPPI